MGSEITADGPPRLHVEAHGTDVIESVQVLRFPTAEGGFSVLFDREPDALDFTWCPASTAGSATTPSTTCGRASAGTSVVGWSWRSSPVWVAQAR